MCASGALIGKAIMVDIGPTTFQGCRIPSGMAVLIQPVLYHSEVVYRMRVNLLNDERSLNIYDAVKHPSYTVRKHLAHSMCSRKLQACH